MQAKIYQPTKTAMQSGTANTNHWILEYECEKEKFIEPLMGWTASSDMRQQIKLKFNTKNEAEQYAKSRKIEYILCKPNYKNIRPKSYSNNFIK
jgi:NADH dehydrogenase